MLTSKAYSYTDKSFGGEKCEAITEGFQLLLTYLGTTGCQVLVKHKAAIEEALAR